MRLITHRFSKSQWLLCTRSVTTTSTPRPFEDIPEPKWSLPYFGTLLHYRLGVFNIANRRQTLLDLRKKYGPIVKETIRGETSVHLFEPEDYRHVYASDGRIPTTRPLLDAIVHYRREKGYSLGVGNTNGEDWYNLRASVRHLMMQPLSVAKFINREQEVTDDVVERLAAIADPDTRIVNNLELEIGKWNFETAALLISDRRLNILETGEDDAPAKMIYINGQLFERAIKLRFSIFPFYKYFSTPLWRKLVKEEDLFYGYFMDIFKSAVNDCREWIDSPESETDIDRFLFLRTLLKREDMSFLDCHVISQSLFTDGMSTTVPTTIGQLYLIATNPDKQEKLYNEICEVVGPQNSQVTAKQLGHMPYLRSCVKEGFRFFPTGLEVSRITNEDLDLSGYHIPAGTAVELNNFAILQDEAYFPNPQSYNPERWLRGSEERIIHPYAHTPFSHGPRQCLGRRFAEQEMYILIVKLIQRFRLEWRDHRPMRQRWRMLNVPDIPAKIAFIERSNATKV